LGKRLDPQTGPIIRRRGGHCSIVIGIVSKKRCQIGDMAGDFRSDASVGPWEREVEQLAILA